MIACAIALVFGIVLMIGGSALAEGRDMQIGRARITRDWARPVTLIGVVAFACGFLGLLGGGLAWLAHRL